MMASFSEEIEAIQKIVAILEPLSPESRVRALRWVGDAFGAIPSIDTVVTQAETAISNKDDHASFADVFHAVSPGPEKEKALVAAYWVTTRMGEEQFASATVNQLLRDLGYRIANVTDALTQLGKERPARVVQMKKSGSSRQARKLYKITTAGIQSVESVLNR